MTINNPSGGALFSNAVITNSNWHFISVTYTTTEVKFYVNGVQQGSGVPDAQDSYANIDATLIGARYYTGAAQKVLQRFNR